MGVADGYGEGNWLDGWIKISVGLKAAISLDVMGDNRPHLPWHFNLSKAKALNAKWKGSRKTGDEHSIFG
ncbi:MAG: hypothetical protein V3V02_10740 [Rhizobiaceae bacterium]